MHAASWHGTLSLTSLPKDGIGCMYKIDVSACKLPPTFTEEIYFELRSTEDIA